MPTVSVTKTLTDASHVSMVRVAPSVIIGHLHLKLLITRYLMFKHADVLSATPLRPVNVFVTLTHSMLPLSLLLVGCVTGTIKKWNIDYGHGRAIWSRDNGSKICNIECTSLLKRDVLSAPIITSNVSVVTLEDYVSIDEHMLTSWTLMMDGLNDGTVIPNTNEYLLTIGLQVDCYKDTTCYVRCHQSYVKTIKTISNTGIDEIKNNISPLFNGTVTIFIGLILFCIRDSLRESKANYVIISSVQLVLMYCFIMSESVVFCVLFSMSYVYLLSPICLICKVSLVYVLMNVYELSLKSTNLLSISAIILTCNSLNNNENLICYI